MDASASISSGQYVMRHRYENGSFSVMVYGHHQFQKVSYAYNAGMKLEVLFSEGIQVCTA